MSILFFLFFVGRLSLEPFVTPCYPTALDGAMDICLCQASRIIPATTACEEARTSPSMRALTAAVPTPPTTLARWGLEPVATARSYPRVRLPFPSYVCWWGGCVLFFALGGSGGVDLPLPLSRLLRHTHVHVSCGAFFQLSQVLLGVARCDQQTDAAQGRA